MATVTFDGLRKMFYQQTSMILVKSEKKTELTSTPCSLSDMNRSETLLRRSFHGNVKEDGFFFPLLLNSETSCFANSVPSKKYHAEYTHLL